MNILFLSPITVPYNALVHLLGDPKFRKDLVLGDDKKNYNKITMPMGILYLGAVIQKSLPDANIDVVDLA